MIALLLSPFTTLARCRINTLNAMGMEMKEHIVDPMAVENFLNEFLLNTKDHDSLDFALCFALASTARVFNLLSIRKEEGTYKPFVSDTCIYYFEIVNSPLDYSHVTICPQLSFMNSSGNADLMNYSAFTFNVKPDVCVYADATSHGCNISKFRVAIKFKQTE